MIIMNTLSFIKRPKATLSNTPFDKLTYSNTSLCVQYRDNLEIAIPFADIDKIYIKKHKLNPVLEFTGIALPFVFVYLVIQYFPSNLMIFASIIGIIPVFVYLNKYKWYRFYIRLNDGTLYRKKISLSLKTESFSTLEKVRAEYISYKYNVSALSS